MLKDSSVLVPENIYNLTYCIKNEFLLTSNFRLFSMKEKDVHITSQQKIFLKKFEGRIERKIRKIEVIRTKLNNEMESMKDKEGTESKRMGRIQQQIQILDKIQLRFSKSIENSETEKLDPKNPEKTPTSKSEVKDPKQKVLGKELKSANKYSKINYLSTLVKIYSDVAQCFRSIPLSKKSTYDSKNNQFIFCYNGTLKGCSNRILSETFAFHSANTWDEDLYGTVFKPQKQDTLDRIRTFGSATNIKSIFHNFLGLIESAHFHCANLPSRVTNWSDLFKFFLTMKKSSAFNKKKIAKLQNKIKKLEKFKNNKKQHKTILTSQQIDFYYPNKKISYKPRTDRDPNIHQPQD